jgi:glycosyltransferase involved in cell wall biosynthesis
MANVIVLPYTRFHSQSGVLADAYTYRLPLVVTDVGAIGPTVREDRTGEVALPGSATGLAQAIARVLSVDRVELETRLDLAAHQHDCSVVGPKIRAIYDLATRDLR